MRLKMMVMMLLIATFTRVLFAEDETWGDWSDWYPTTSSSRIEQSDGTSWGYVSPLEINEDLTGTVIVRNPSLNSISHVDIPSSLTMEVYRSRWSNLKHEQREYKQATLKVLAIGWEAFYYSYGDMSSVSIPDSVVEIGDSAFERCTGLTTITIPSSVTKLGKEAFKQCTSLKSIVLSSNMKSIESLTFEECSSLESITIPASVTNVDASAFYKCSSVKSVRISGRLQNVAFLKNLQSSLEELIVDGSVQKIDNSALCGCTSLKSVSIAEVESIGSYAFSGCSELESVVLPDGLTEIERYAFDNCSKLLEIKLPDSLTAIYEYAFRGCGLTNVAIPACVANIGNYALSGCRGLRTVTIPEGVTSVGSGAFSCCTGVKNVTIPSSVTSIGGSAFSGCSGLTNVTISEGVASIGSTAFRNCTGLTNVTIPSSVTSIGNYAFYGCSGLTSVAISEGVSSIGDYAFRDCTSLMTLTIPSSVTSIGSSAFYNCKDLTAVRIGNGVSSIGSSAFYGCSKLGEVEIGSSVSSLGAQCFCSCMNLTNVVFHGNAPTTIGGLVFSETSLDLNVVVPVGSVGWNGDGASAKLPARWPYNTETGRYIRNAGDDPISSEQIVEVQLTVTNIIVNYILNSVQPEFAVPVSSDTGFVNIIAEVHGSASGAVAVPDSWPANYKEYHKKFGSDFTQSLTQRTGKKDSAGNDMFVWQDFVAGTDPTDEDDVFTASVTMVEGVPVISYTPELTAEEKAKRTYRTLGKVKLSDADWVEVPSGHEADYNFFKVSVEMK